MLKTIQRVLQNYSVDHIIPEDNVNQLLEHSQHYRCRLTIDLLYWRQKLDMQAGLGALIETELSTAAYS